MSGQHDRPTLAFVALMVLVGGCERNTPSEGVERVETPSLLLITLDTTRADRIGCYGHAGANTPALDALSQSGVLFENAFCQVPLTLPSHASLLTGTYPRTNGVRVNGVALGDGVATLAEVARGRGYRTGAFVSAMVLDSRYGLSRGFDTYDDDLGAHNAVERRADRVTDAALAWLGASSKLPFFAWVHYFDPHSPYAPPAPYNDGSADPYDGEIAFVDAQVARLMGWLQSSGMRKNTLLIVAGDHGEAFGEHGETEHGFFVYGPTMHVPLILSFPAKLPAAAKVAQPVGLVDLFPTVVELLEWPERPDLEGISLGALVDGAEGNTRAVYGESEYPRLGFGWAGLYSLTTARWKFIDAPKAELFDRTRDPGELDNVVAKHAAVASELHSQLAARLKRMERRTGPTDTARVHALSALESLGYVSGAASAVDSNEDTPRRDPKDMVSLYEAHSDAVSALLGGRYEEVIATMERLVRESPESDEFYNTLGRAYLETGRAAEAQRALEMSLRLAPDNPRRLRRLGEALQQQRKLSDAAAALRAALAIAPEFAEAHCSLGDVLGAMGKANDALNHYETAVNAAPDLARARSRLGVACAKQQRFSEAAIHLRRYLELEPGSPHALTNLGNVLFQMRQVNEATDLLKKAIELDPSYATAHMSLIQILLAQGKTSEGVATLRAARAAIPGSIQLTRRLAWMLATTKLDEVRRPSEALELARQVVAGRTPTADDFAVLAAAYAAGGDFDQAVEHARRAISLAESRQDARTARRIQRHLQYYEAGHPYRE